MEISAFINHFASQLEETEASTLVAGTKLREIEEWSSFTGLSVIAMVDEVYHVKLRGDDVRQAVTIQDLFDTVQSKIA
jgi:acyl carrier protein